MKKISLLLILLAIAFCLMACDPDSMMLLRDTEKQGGIENHIESLTIKEPGNIEEFIFTEPQDIKQLAELCLNFRVDKSVDTDENSYYGYWVCFLMKKNREQDATVTYYFYIKNDGSIVKQDARIGSTPVYYIAQSTEIINEVKRLCATKN